MHFYVQDVLWYKVALFRMHAFLRASLRAVCGMYPFLRGTVRLGVGIYAYFACTFARRTNVVRRHTGEAFSKIPEKRSKSIFRP